MKKILTLTLTLGLVLILVVLTGCSIVREEGRPNELLPVVTVTEDNNQTPIPQKLRQAVAGWQQSKLTPEITALFYDYYSDYDHDYTADYVSHTKELRLLPEFGEGPAPQWDELTHFVYYHAQEDAKGKYGEKLISKSSFEQTVQRFFPDFTYTHQSSSFLQLTDDGYYTPTGWDDHGSVHYRLTKLEKNSQGVYSASFIGFYVHEDIWSDNPRENLQVVQAKASELGFNGKRLDPSEFKEVMRKLVLDPAYSDLLTEYATLEIRFEISGDSEYPLRYISCQRNSASSNDEKEEDGDSLGSVEAEDAEGIEGIEDIEDTDDKRALAAYETFYKEKFGENTAVTWFYVDMDKDGSKDLLLSWPEAYPPKGYIVPQLEVYSYTSQGQVVLSHREKVDFADDQTFYYGLGTLANGKHYVYHFQALYTLQTFYRVWTLPYKNIYFFIRNKGLEDNQYEYLKRDELNETVSATKNELDNFLAQYGAEKNSLIVRRDMWGVPEFADTGNFIDFCRTQIEKK